MSWSYIKSRIKNRRKVSTRSEQTKKVGLKLSSELEKKLKKR